MSDLFWLTPEQLRHIEPYFPLSHCIPRVDDLRVVSGIIHVIRNDLRWRDAPVNYGPHKTLYNRFVRWSRMGVFNRIFAALAENAGSRPISAPVVPMRESLLRPRRPGYGSTDDRKFAFEAAESLDNLVEYRLDRRCRPVIAVAGGLGLGP